LIPHPIAALTGVSVLVTRPAAQSDELCKRIVAMGGEAISFPVIAIEPIADIAAQPAHDWLIFISANAVRHGMQHVARDANTRIAAIGKATAEALAAQKIQIDAKPERGVDSESLLTHPALADVSGKRVLIVKGAGGRDALREGLSQRGAQVTELEAYRRVLHHHDASAIAALEQRWRDGGIDILTLTSVETLDNLEALLTDPGRVLLHSTPFVALSERIATAARSKGLRGECVLSRGADDAAICGAIAAWHARAR
jgi:uroporphyrinogen-III synthase